MKQVLIAICAVTLAGTVVAQEKQPESGAITVSGCVAPGAGADQFQLINASMATAAVDKEKMPGDKPKMGLGATYNLLGGTNLKAHVGHRVEVTGTVAKPDAAAKPPAGAETIRGTLNVSNVKMVSTTCP